MFDSKISFREHIRSIASRGNQRLSFFRKACRVLDHHGRLVVYKGFVRPVLEYCPLVWMGAASSHLAKLDKVQQRAMRMIGRGTLLPSLEIRRTVAALSYLYKLQFITGPSQLTDLVPPFAGPVSQPPKTRHQSLVKHGFQMLDTLPAVAPDTLRRSFPYCVIPTWNALPPDLLCSRPHKKGLQKFKVSVNRHLTQKHWVWATNYQG